MTVTVRPQCKENGFTLIELAVVLMIVAVLIGGLLIPLSAQRDIRSIQETEQRLNEAREALIGFALAHGRLPRPAVSATDGSERGGNCSTATPDDCSGFIPWAVLGVEKTDAWGKLIRYSVTPAYANGSITLTTVANRKVQTRDAAGVVSYLAGQAGACTTASQCVPAVIFSHGKRRWGTSDSGTAFGDDSATNADEDANNNGPSDYYSRVPTDTAGTGGEFDDLVVWLPTTILFNRMVAAGTLP